MVKTLKKSRLTLLRWLRSQTWLFQGNGNHKGAMIDPFKVVETIREPSLLNRIRERVMKMCIDSSLMLVGMGKPKAWSRQVKLPTR